MTEKPKDWNPAEHGFKVTANHDYDGRRPSGRKPLKPKVVDGSKGLDPEDPSKRQTRRFDESMKGERRTTEYKKDPFRDQDVHMLLSSRRSADDEEAPEGQGENSSQQSGGGQTPPPVSSIREGGKALEGLEKAQAGRSNDAAPDVDEIEAKIKVWEQRFGMNLDKLSEGERQGLHDYVRWIYSAEGGSPWKKDKKTPAEKVNSVTIPVAEEFTLAITEYLLKNGGPVSKSVGRALGPLGVAKDMLVNPNEVW